MLKLIGQRLFLREHTLNDFASFYDWQSDPKVAKYLTWLPKTKEESLKDLNDIILEQSNPNRTKFFLAIVLIESRQVIGDTGITKLDFQTGDMGWFIRSKYWGNNYASEAAKLVIKFGFEQLKFKTIKASCNALNEASKKVMTKCGFSLIQKKEDRRFYEIKSE